MKLNASECFPTDFFSAADFPDDIVYPDIFSSPFVINGLADPCQTRILCRLPEDVMVKCSGDIQGMAHCPAGGRIRFSTDSPWIAIAVHLKNPDHGMSFSRVGDSGIDIYTGPKGAGVAEQKFFLPCMSKDSDDSYHVIHHFEDGFEAPREITLYLPPFNKIQELYIGLKKDFSVWEPAPYRLKKPILFYGSSITHGAFASRPGNSYPAHLSRWLDSDFICLGFAGRAKGEQALAEYIASLSLSAFVMDYDHNAPNPEFLDKTHYPFYETIRKAQPDLPILMISKPDFQGFTRDGKRRDIIMQSYLRGRENGDRHLAFLDGETLFGNLDRDACTVDGCHPNDLGFYRMAEGIYPRLRELLHLLK